MTPNYSNRVILGDGSDFETTLSKGEGGGGGGGGGGGEEKKTGNRKSVARRNSWTVAA